MYLASLRRSDGLHYILRETYDEGGILKFRDLYDLGTDPTKVIVYPGGNGFYYASDFEEALQEKGVIYSSEDLDEIFLPFLIPRIRRVLEMFPRGRRTTENRWKRYTRDELLLKQENLHPFDMRRLHFLRCGRIDIGDLGGRLFGFTKILMDKSRDEIECTLQDMETKLRPHEVRSYIYSAFNLQSWFHNNLLQNHPDALDAEKVDGFFLEEVCSLNRSKAFFRGVSGHDFKNLHSYLTKYVILYFDHAFDAAGRWNEFIQDYARRSWNGRRFSPQPPMPESKALEIMGISEEELKAMTRRDLTRLYRSKAKELHPDKGGDHDDFVKLTEAYEDLLLRK